MRLGVVGAIQNANNPLFLSNNFAAFPSAVGTAMLYNQQDRPLLFSTGYATDNFTGGNSTLERVRIQSVGTVTQITPSTYSTYNPGNLATQLTRVSISHNPANPVTRPLSLLHLGYNTGAVSANPASTDGWRSWMDIGTFTTNGTDNMYVGLKNKNGPLGDRYDAIIGWGDNQISALPPGNGPDNLRFIFTSTTAPTGGGTAPATTQDGLEGARMSPTPNNGVFTGFGGSPGVNPYSNGINPGNNLEINSWGAATTAGGSSGLRFTDLNASTPTIANPGNGVLAVDANGDVVYVEGGNTSLGNNCSDPSNPLTDDYIIPMANRNFTFSLGRSVNIGDVFCGLNSPARTYIRNSFGFFGITEGLRVESVNPGDVAVRIFGPPQGTGYAIEYDGDGLCNGSLAGTGLIAVVSDAAVKKSIQNINNALSIIGELRPVTFFYDTTNTPELNFDLEKQFGFVADEVQTIIPEVVKTIPIPEFKDSLGNVTQPATNLKGLNYNNFIAILTKGIQEQQSIIQSQDSALNALQNQINTLYGIISNCCNNGQLGLNPNETRLTITNVELSDAKSIVLDQNVPNPFAEQTTISYFLTKNVKKAQILFHNQDGKLIQSVELTEKGNGQINVFANDLSNGIYTYTLVADGQIIATKKMIKQN